MQGRLRLQDVFSSGLGAKGFLELIPCAAAVWHLGDPGCFFNQRTICLIGYSPEEFRTFPNLWIDNINPADRGAYLAARKKVENSEDVVASCEYRFMPKGRKEEKWLSERSGVFQLADKEHRMIISVYSDISEFVRRRQLSHERDAAERWRQIGNGLAHEVDNHLQVIHGAVELIGGGAETSKEYQLIEDGIATTSKLMTEFQDYFYESSNTTTSVDAIIVVEQALQGMESELFKQGVKIRFAYPEERPRVQTDPCELRQAFFKVIEFARVLFSHGGELLIDAGLGESEGVTYLVLSVSIMTVACVQIDAVSAFRPYLKVGNRSAGLNMIAARDILCRHEGKIVFEKTAGSSGVIRMYLKPVCD
jgi:hypothetical protein